MPNFSRFSAPLQPDSDPDQDQREFDAEWDKGEDRRLQDVLDKADSEKSRGREDFD